jgi:hypothetical protein
MGFSQRWSNLAIVRASWAKRLWLGAAGVAVFIATVWTAHALAPKPGTHDAGFGLDFIAFYTAGSFVEQGRLVDLYNLDAVHQFQRELATANYFDIGRAYGPWWNPPFYALVFKPLATLPYRVASAIWIGLNLICFAFACVLLCRFLPEKARWQSWALVPVVTMLSAPFILAFSHAQNTCTSLLLLVATVTFWRKGRALIAGVVGGLLFYKPQLAALLALVLVIDLGWRALAGYAITGATLLAINLIALPGTLSDYLYRLPKNVTAFQTGTLYPWEQHVTLKAFWRLLLQGHSLGDATPAVTILWILTAAIIAVMLIAAAVRTRSTRGTSEYDPQIPSRRDRLIIATIVSTPLLMPFYFDYDLLLLAVPAVLFATHFVGQQHRAHSKSDRWILANWIALYIWQMVNDEVARKFHLNVSVLLLASLALMLITRIGRSEIRRVRDSEVDDASLRRAA